MKIPELVAPAGSFETLEAAFAHGADAVYAGVGRFNLRAHAPSFAQEDLGEAIALARREHRRFYVTLNAMPSDSEVDEIRKLLCTTASGSALPDAVIVSDAGVLRLCRQCLDTVPIHLSTQTGVFNRESLAFWHDQGVSRVVLPRELNLEEIGGLSETGLCETEVFVHGAMCVSISGRCLLGAYQSGRHPNRGDCPQPCRLRYSLQASDSGGSVQNSFEAEETERGVYLLNSKDLCTLDILPRILESGVAAIKIEGRNKSVHYVSAVVKIYRMALDRYAADPAGYAVDPEWTAELDTVDHRPYTTGFYKGEYMLQEPVRAKVASTLRVVGVVKAVLEDGRAVVDVRNPFTNNEVLSVLPVKRSVAAYDISFGELTDLKGQGLNRAVSNRLAVVTSGSRLFTGDMIRRKTAKDGHIQESHVVAQEE
jgi:U32 family peptidase